MKTLNKVLALLAQAETVAAANVLSVVVMEHIPGQRAGETAPVAYATPSAMEIAGLYEEAAHLVKRYKLQGKLSAAQLQALRRNTWVQI